jgi:hypothetical protein
VVAAWSIAFRYSDERARSPISDSLHYVRLRVFTWQTVELWILFAALHRNLGSVSLGSDTRPAIHEVFSELSPIVDVAIMQLAGHLSNVGIV